MEEKPVVLLVVEDPVLSEVTGFRLQLLGYEVGRVASGEEGLPVVKAERPDIVIVEMEVGGMGGLSFIEAIGRDQETTNTPILAISSDAELDSVQRAFRAGAIDYLVTPYNPLVLEAKVLELAAMVGKTV